MCVDGASKTLAGEAALFLFVALVLGHAWPATAQDEEPIGRFVVDLRGSLVPFARNEELALLRSLDPRSTPGLGFGFEVGGHVYPFRWRAITFGLGARFHASRADQRPPRPNATEAGEQAERGPTLRKTFTALSPELSFNFGGRDGWSYVSGGLSTSGLLLYSRDGPEPRRRGTRTLNYGGGARWFVSDHLAFSLDLRFYAMTPLPESDTDPGSPRLTTMVLNVGASFK